VLFFGTAEFSWIDASRNVSPWETDKVARVVKDKSIEFKRVWSHPGMLRSGRKLFKRARLSTQIASALQALQEATTYINTGNLPESFSLEALQDRESSGDEPDEEPTKPTPPGARRSTYPLLAGDEVHMSVRERRRLTVQRQLGLKAPYQSPSPVLNPNVAYLLQQVPPLGHEHTQDLHRPGAPPEAEQQTQPQRGPS
jgi:hypothetical protein